MSGPTIKQSCEGCFYHTKSEIGPTSPNLLFSTVHNFNSEKYLAEINMAMLIAYIYIQWRLILNDQGSIICHKSGHIWASYRPLVFFFFIYNLGYVPDLPGCLLFIFCQENAARGKIYIPPKIGCMKYISLKPILTHLLGGAV